MENFLKKIYTLIIQHMSYIRKLEAACGSGGAFQHKSERECEFGKLFYGEVMPYLGEMPDDVRESILEVEKLHTEFHTRALSVGEPCTQSRINDLHKIADYLIIRLTRLESGQA